MSHRVSHFDVYFLIFFNIFYLSRKNKNLGKYLFSEVSAPVREKIRTPDTLVRSHELFAVFSRLSREGNTSGDTPNKKVQPRYRYRSSNGAAMKGE